MKYLTKKVIKGKQYYYLQFGKHTKFLGTFLPDNLKDYFKSFFQEIANMEFLQISAQVKKEFKYLNLKQLECARFEHLLLKHELFEREYHEYYKKLIVLFTYNSNRAEGSKTKKDEVERMYPWSKRKPKGKTEIEIADSFKAFNYAFSDEMKWNLKGIKRVHRLLLGELDPLIAGEWKTENNVAPGNDITTSFKDVPEAMKGLIEFLNKGYKSSTYPPILALSFYCKFEKIHPFLDGNGRTGRILLNAILNRLGYPPVIFFAENKRTHSAAIRAFTEGRPSKMHRHFLGQLKRTEKELF